MKLLKSMVIVVAIGIFFPLACFGSGNNDLTVLFTGDMLGQITPKKG